MKKTLTALALAAAAFTSTAATASIDSYNMVCNNRGGDSISLVVEWDSRLNKATAVNVDTNGLVRLGRPLKGNKVDIKLFSNNDEFVYRMDIKGEGVFKYVFDWSNGNIYLQRGDSRFTPEVIGRWGCRTQ